jgi:hypothetical protein
LSESQRPRRGDSMTEVGVHRVDLGKINVHCWRWSVVDLLEPGKVILDTYPFNVEMVFVQPSNCTSPPHSRCILPSEASI